MDEDTLPIAIGAPAAADVERARWAYDNRRLAVLLGLLVPQRPGSPRDDVDEPSAA